MGQPLGFARLQAGRGSQSCAKQSYVDVSRRVRVGGFIGFVFFNALELYCVAWKGLRGSAWVGSHSSHGVVRLHARRMRCRPDAVFRRARILVYGSAIQQLDCGHAFWAPRKLTHNFGRWFGKSVFAVHLESSALRAGISELCFTLEGRNDGRLKSNQGGFQSKELVAHNETFLLEFVSHLHKPLAVFLAARVPVGYSRDASNGLAIAAVADQLWVNVNRPGDWNNRHHHGEPSGSLVASGVYYPAAAGGAAVLTLFPEGEPPVDIAPSEGLLVMFPPDVEHTVEPLPQGSAARISLAFNIHARWLDMPIHKAAIAGDVDAVERICANTTIVDEADSVLGLRAIHLAAEAGHVAVVKSLADRGADTLAVSWEGFSPLGLAAERGHVAVSQYLIRSAMDMESLPLVEDHLSQNTRTAPSGAELRQIGRHGPEGALEAAARRGHLPVVQLLAGTVGSPMTLPSLFAGCGGLPLSFAVANGYAPIVSYLLDCRSGIPSPRYVRPLLHEAASHGHTLILEMLLAARADVNTKGPYREVAAHYAAAKGHIAALDVLASAPGYCFADAVDAEGLRPADWAAHRGRDEVVKHLAAGAGVDS